MRAATGRALAPSDGDGAASLRARLRVGVAPAEALAARRSLFAALEQAFPARFEGRAAGARRDLDALVAFAADADAQPSGLPTLTFARRGAARQSLVELAAAGPLGPLAGRRLVDSDVAGTGLAVGRAQTIVASAGRRALWTLGPDGSSAVAAVPCELEPNERLRERLQPGRFLCLLALTQFLRAAADRAVPAPPPLRAAVVVDDPNLHRPSYGYVRFQELARRARALGVHVAVATVPRDLWYADRRAAATFRDNPDVLSLAVHGNDHLRHELADHDAETAAAVVAQALRRVERFEARARLRVDRVMVPPHDRCGAAVLDALAVAGFDAACWSPPLRSPAAGLDVADVADGGLPSLSRKPLRRWDEMAFRAYLGQPLVLEAHHTDFADGLDVLDEAAAELARLGRVAWLSLGGIAETNVSTRREGERLRARLYSRRVRLAVPDGARELVVETPPYAGRADELVRVSTPAGTIHARLLEPVTVEPGSVELRLVRRSQAPTPPGRARPSAWPLLRRTLAEGRDRALPVVSALRSRRRSASPP